MKLKYYGVIGMAAALLGCIGDVLLLYVPNGGYEKWDYTFFSSIAYWRLLAGHYLGVLFIPFQLVGFWQIYQAIKSAENRFVLPVMAMTLYVIIIGVAYHGMLGELGTFLQLNESSGLATEIRATTKAQLIAFLEPLGGVLFVLFLGISLGLWSIIRYQNTLYPRWMAWVNPLFIYVLITGVYVLFPSWGSALMVAGFNLSIFILLTCSTIVLWNK